ncbi:MAG: efflux RND transporter periplasmic adaptor subunit [Alphaproteobacteria bacterium]|nr:efflux RND transporter periplasmic adaptor subunit [Alphaproteobacteria bacterium]
MRVPRPVPFLIFLALSVAVSSCGKAVEAKKAEAVAEAILVSNAEVTFADVTTPIVGTGNITPVKLTDIGPSVDGIIDEVMVKVGDVVKKGDALFRTRDVDTKLQIRELEQQVALARAQYANANSDMKRQSSLKSGGWVSQSRMDTTRTNAAVALAQAGVWEARLAAARQQLKDTVVRAPYDGVITRKDVYEGRFMATRFGGGGMMGGAAGVVQIMDIAIVAAIVNVPESYLAQMELGLPAKIHVDGLDKTYDAKIAVINHRVDDRTRSVEVRFGIDNKDLKIKPGLFCRADILPPARKVLVVARKAVLGSEGAHYAYIAQNGRAKKIALSARDLDGERVEITSNVPAGTMFLTGPNLAQLADGMAVKLESEKAKPAASPAPKAASL